MQPGSCAVPPNMAKSVYNTTPKTHCKCEDPFLELSLFKTSCRWSVVLQHYGTATSKTPPRPPDVASSCVDTLENHQLLK